MSSPRISSSGAGSGLRRGRRRRRPRSSSAAGTRRRRHEMSWPRAADVHVALDAVGIWGTLWRSRVRGSKVSGESRKPIRLTSAEGASSSPSSGDNRDNEASPPGPRCRLANVPLDATSYCKCVGIPICNVFDFFAHSRPAPVSAVPARGRTVSGRFLGSRRARSDPPRAARRPMRS